jgi:hypothetical protein
MKCPITALFTLAMFALAACGSPANNILQNSAPTGTSVASTATIVWFPPSETPTAQVFPSRVPTPERKPGVGSILLADDFSSANAWNISSAAEAGVDISNRRIALAAGPGLYIASLRQGIVFDNFYAEITARPSICRAADEYGLLFRAPNNVAYYGFALSCTGTAAVERLSVRTPHILHAAVPSADVPPGAPGEVRMGVWANGPEFRFFLNDHYQFSVTDRNYASGGIGVFARSAGATPVTVTFSDLAVYEVIYAIPKGTSNP